MRHLQIYESFDNDKHKVAAYTSFPEYREFKLSTIHETSANSVVQWFREEDFNKKIANGFPVYVVDNKWEFWENQDKPPVNWPESKPAVKASRLDRSGQMPSSQESMERIIGRSYKELIDMAKTPEEVMADEIEEDPAVIEDYSGRRPMIYEKAVKILKSRGTMPPEESIEALKKWKKIKKYI
jgi:hypothetical protein